MLPSNDAFSNSQTENQEMKMGTVFIPEQHNSLQSGAAGQFPFLCSLLFSCHK